MLKDEDMDLLPVTKNQEEIYLANNRPSLIKRFILSFSNLMKIAKSLSLFIILAIIFIFIILLLRYNYNESEKSQLTYKTLIDSYNTLILKNFNKKEFLNYATLLENNNIQKHEDSRWNIFYDDNNLTLTFKKNVDEKKMY